MLTEMDLKAKANAVADTATNVRTATKANFRGVIPSWHRSHEV